MALKVNKLPTDADIRRMFDAVPILERYKVADQVVRAGSKPIMTRARQLVPRSKPADTAKRSAKQRNSADWDTPLWKTVKQVVRTKSSKNKGGAVAIVGPENVQAGSKIYLIAEHKTRTRRRVLWGKEPVTIAKVVLRMRNLITQAFDETKSMQLSAMRAKLKTVLDEVWKRG